jgi:hypothetical protein
MNPRPKSRLLAAGCVIVLLGLGTYRIDTARREMGKEGYLAQQSTWFDTMYVRGHPVGHFIGVGLLMGGGVLGLYELLALGIRKVLKGRERSNGREIGSAGKDAGA